MSKENRNVEFDQAVEEKLGSFSFRDLINGNVLKRKAVIKQSRFIALIVALAFILIINRNQAESTVIQLDNLGKDVRELRAKSISTSSELVRISRQSEVLRMVHRNGLGLDENLEPPKKLIKEEK